MIVLKILAFIFLLGLIIGIHEFGHLLAAKLFKVHVHSYALGMGPRIFHKQIKETSYELRLLPVGGFVSMAGESVNPSKNDEAVPEDRKYYNKKYWQKVIILLAGVVMNFILAIILFSCLVLKSGYATPIKNTISEVTEYSAAYDAGIQPNDKIIAIHCDNKTTKINTFFDITVAIIDATDKTNVVIDYERDGQLMSSDIKLQYNEEEDRYLIGIVGKADEIYEVKWYNAPYFGFRYFIDTLDQFWSSLRILFKPGGLKYLSGPIGIAQATSSAVSAGFIAYIYLIALISANVGIMNLLPLPILDGGQIVFETIQKITKKPIPEKVKLIVILISWLLIIALMVVVFRNDILRLFKIIK